jgi:hypothetical protein
MSKLIDDTPSDDLLLNELSTSTRPVVDSFEESPDHAVFILGVKLITDGEETQGVQTFINASGFYGILSEGLYAELGDMMSGGDMSLFSVLRDVVRDLEEDFGISPDEDITESDSPELYH